MLCKLADRGGDAVDLRHKAIEVLLAVSAGAYQTTLLTYMIQRDLFPSIMKVGSQLAVKQHGPNGRLTSYIMS